MTRIAVAGAICFLSLSLSAVRGAVFIPLGDLPGGAFHSEATRVSADGSTVVGWSMTDLGREAFRWTRDEGMTSLEISKATGLCRYMLARRLPEINALRRGTMKICNISKRLSVTWWLAK